MARAQRGQAAFEYMMSYGWAVLVIVVLAVALWNIGVFNPVTVNQAAGFSLLRPVAWDFRGGNISSTYATIVIWNIGGTDITLGINGTNEKYTMMFKKAWAPNCGFINQSIGVRNAIGEELSVSEDEVNGVGYVYLPAGDEIIINGTMVGARPDYQCGGVLVRLSYTSYPTAMH
jgi:hypothetical protein